MKRPIRRWKLGARLAWIIIGLSAWTSLGASDLGGIRTMLDAGRFAEAEAEARGILPDVERANGADSLETAGVLDLLLESILGGGRTSGTDARQIADRAVSIRENARGSEDPDLAVSLSLRARLLHAQGEYAVAAREFERVLQIREKAYGADHPLIADTLSGLGRALTDAGDHVGAKSALERAVAIGERISGPDDPALAKALGILATVLYRMGQLFDARELRERSLSILERSEGSGSPSVALELNNLSNVLTELGDWARGRELLERSLAIREKLLGKDHPDVAQTLNNLGILLKNTGDYAAARPIQERALRIRESALGIEHPKVAQSLSNLATLLTHLGDDPQARFLLERAIRLREKALGPGHWELAAPLNTLGELLTREGRFSEARSTLERALAIEEESLGPTHPWVAQTSASLGALHLAMGDSAAARPRYERARDVLAVAGGPENTNYFNVLGGIARMEWLDGHREAALEIALAAERFSRDHFRRTALSLAEREALLYEGVRISGIDLSCSYLARPASALSPAAAAARVWDQIVGSRAMVLDEMAARHRVRSELREAGIGEQMRALEEARIRLAQIAVRGPSKGKAEEFQARLRAAQQEEERAERSLSERSNRFRKDRERARLDLGDIRTSLPDGGGLIAFVRFSRMPEPPSKTAKPTGDSTAKAEHSYLALALRNARAEPKAIHLGAASRIDSLIDDWKREASTPPPGTPAAAASAERRYREIGSRLRAAVWDPIAREVRGARIVFVVPDGPLNLVSFAALPTGKSAYLLETGPLVHYLSSERDLAASPEPDRTGAGLLVLGGPDFDARPNKVPSVVSAAGSGPAIVKAEAAALDSGSTSEVFRGARSSCGDSPSLRFDPLPSSESEAVEVADLWTRHMRQGASGNAGVTRLTGAQAEEGALKRSVHGRRVLHLATHAFFAQDRCETSLTNAADEVRLSVSQAFRLPGAPGENPFLLSGLALAGANRRHEATADPKTEDGILTAEEIANMDLSGVDWAVLSACETGVGRLQAGEGVLGLRRAFETAGAGTLIMSLWSVSDLSTRKWMKALHEARLGGSSTPESLRKASLTIIKSQRDRGLTTHPFHWGGFVAAGNWN